MKQVKAIIEEQYNVVEKKYNEILDLEWAAEQDLDNARGEWEEARDRYGCGLYEDEYPREAEAYENYKEAEEKYDNLHEQAKILEEILNSLNDALAGLDDLK